MPGVWPHVILIIPEDLYFVLRGTREEVVAECLLGLLWRLCRWCLLAVVARLICKPGYREETAEKGVFCGLLCLPAVRWKRSCRQVSYTSAKTQLLVPGTCSILPPYPLTPTRLIRLQNSSNPRNDPNPGETNVCLYLSSRWQHLLPYEIQLTGSWRVDFFFLLVRLCLQPLPFSGAPCQCL